MVFHWFSTRNEAFLSHEISHTTPMVSQPRNAAPLAPLLVSQLRSELGRAAVDVPGASDLMITITMIVIVITFWNVFYGIIVVGLHGMMDDNNNNNNNSNRIFDDIIIIIIRLVRILEFL